MLAGSPKLCTPAAGSVVSGHISDRACPNLTCRNRKGSSSATTRTEQLSPQVHRFGLRLKSSAGAGADSKVVAQGQLQLQGESRLKQPACALKNPAADSDSKSAIARIRAFFISYSFPVFKQRIMVHSSFRPLNTRQKRPQLSLELISASWFLMPYPSSILRIDTSAPG